MTTTHRIFPISFTLAFAGLLGCGAFSVAPAARPKDPTPPGAAKVCFIRQGLAGAASTFPVRDNGILVGATVGGSCFCYLAAAGKHEIETRSDGYDTIDIEVTAAKDYTLVHTTQEALGSVRGQIQNMDPETGKAALDKCEYQVLTQVPQGQVQPKPGAVVVAK